LARKHGKEATWEAEFDVRMILGAQFGFRITAYVCWTFSIFIK